jgi:hypothetical protein
MNFETPSKGTADFNRRGIARRIGYDACSNPLVTLGVPPPGVSNENVNQETFLPIGQAQIFDLFSCRNSAWQDARLYGRPRPAATFQDKFRTFGLDNLQIIMFKYSRKPTELLLKVK